MLSKISQTEKEKCQMFSLYVESSVSRWISGMWNRSCWEWGPVGEGRVRAESGVGLNMVEELYIHIWEQNYEILFQQEVRVVVRGTKGVKWIEMCCMHVWKYNETPQGSQH
jgi:hypothetical protein